MNTRYIQLNESQIGLCVDAAEFFIDNMMDMFETLNDTPDDSEILKVAKMMQLINVLNGENVKPLYLRTDDHYKCNFWIETLGETKTWFTEYVETNFDDDYSDEELEEIYESIEKADADELCEMLIPNEYWIEEIPT